MSYLAGIVLFNPDILRLKENIEAIIPQVNKIILVDNASQNAAEIDSLLTHYPSITKISNKENVGIAKALNQICEFAFSSGYIWALTLDQDSVAPTNLIEQYNKFAETPLVAMLTPHISDRNLGDESESNSAFDFVDQCITSASAIKVQIWKDLGGYCEKMFIDCVDFDICYRLTEMGYKILRVNTATLIHEVGKGKVCRIFGKKAIVYNHSPLRCYYMSRNTLYLGMRHKRFLHFLLHSLKRALLINLFESNKLQKNKMIIHGYFDFLRGKYGKL